MFIYWLCWVLVAALGRSLPAELGGSAPWARASRCGGSSRWEHQLGSIGPGLRRVGLVVPGYGGIFLEQGLNPCPLHWQADSRPLDHQGSPLEIFNSTIYRNRKPPKCLISKGVKVAQSCPTLCDPMDYTGHGILQARILQWVTFPLSRGSNLGLLHCMWILHQLSHKGSPISKGRGD